MIEYSYTINSDFDFPNWQFQRNIPTRRSEYWAIIPEIFIYQKYTQGYLPLSVNETKSITFYGINAKAYHWAIDNVPAFKPEPYMTTENDYVSKMNFALSHINYPTYTKEIMGSWEKLNANLLNSEVFGKPLNGSNFLKDKVEELTAGITDPLKKTEVITNYVKQNSEWDGDEDFGVVSLKKVVEAKKGSSGDLNLLLGAMLKKAGVDVEMVLLSTRDHGFIRQSFPMTRQFNYTICQAMIGDKMLLLDATEKNLPYDVIPSRCLNDQGLVISEKRFGWINIVPKAKAKTYISAELKLDDAGVLDGKVNYASDGYDAQEMRDSYKAKGEETFAKDFLGSKQWTVVNKEFKDFGDLSKTAKVNYEVKIEEHASSAGNVIYINPFITRRLEENPFKSETREYPVDYGSKEEITYNVKFIIPDGYTIDELPKSKIISLPENSARYVYNISQLGNTINLTSSFMINKVLFIQDEYPLLREFYNQVVAKEAEQIVVKKK